MKKILIATCLTISACASTPQMSTSEHINAGFEDLGKKNPRAAIKNHFNPAISSCEAHTLNTKERVYAARSPAESLYYMVRSAAQNEQAIAISPDCADLYYLKGYAYVELGNLEEAEKNLHKAIQLSPVNSRYISELGNIYQTKKDWNSALAAFKDAEEFAKTFSPDDVKNSEYSRAKRGVGYSLIELGDLDGAEKKFNECLAIDPNDASAKNELRYINSLRTNSFN